MNCIVVNGKFVQLANEQSAQKEILQQAALVEGELAGLTEQVHKMDGIVGTLLINHHSQLKQLTERIGKLEISQNAVH